VDVNRGHERNGLWGRYGRALGPSGYNTVIDGDGAIYFAGDSVSRVLCRWVGREVERRVCPRGARHLDLGVAEPGTICVASGGGVSADIEA